MKLKLILTAVLLSSFQLFFAQNTTNDTIKKVKSDTINKLNTVVASTAVADKEVLRKEAKEQKAKMREEKKALKEAQKAEREKKAFEKEQKAFAKRQDRILSGE